MIVDSSVLKVDTKNLDKEILEKLEEVEKLFRKDLKKLKKKIIRKEVKRYEISN